MNKIKNLMVVRIFGKYGPRLGFRWYFTSKCPECGNPGWEYPTHKAECGFVAWQDPPVVVAVPDPEPVDQEVAS